MDPTAVAKHYTSCRLNTSKTSLEGYGLESLLCYIQQTTTLENAHNSRVDARAQAQVVFHEYFHNYIDKSKSIVAMDKILMVKHKNHEKCNEEAKRQVPGG